MEVAITAVGTANPIHKLEQQRAAEIISAALFLTPTKKKILKSVYKSAGIKHRYSVIGDYCKEPGQFEFFPNDAKSSFPTTAERMMIYKQHALDLVLTAIKNCLANFRNFDKRKITHVIVVSCTGMYAPGIDIEVVQQLGLNSTTKRTLINFMGCYAAFNGLKIADAICRSELEAKVLLVSVELCTIHLQKKSSMANIISNAIFADGAAAVLIERVAKKRKCLKITGSHCDLLPQSNQEMAWSVADYGFDIGLSPYVPKLIKSGIRKFTDSLLNFYGMTLDQISFYAIHPGGMKILQACEESLQISKTDNKYSYRVLKNYGNMSSVTILFVLKEILEDIKAKDHNKNIFSCAFGPGLTLESMLLQVHHVF